MVDTTTAVQPEDRAFSTRVREWITSAVLIAFTTAVGVACVIALSSTLTQTRMSSIVIDGVALSIWKLDDIRLQWAQIRQENRHLSNGITDAEHRRTLHTAEVTDAEQQFLAKQTALIIRIEELLFRLRSADPVLTQKIETSQRVAEQYGLLSTAQEALLREQPQLQASFDALNAAYKDYGVARGRRADAQAKSQAIIQEIQTLQNALAGSQTSLESLYGQVHTKSEKLDDGTRSRVENALYELHSGRGLLGTFINLLVTTQPDILTLTLVILMGVLGSSLQMTYAFFKQHRVEKVGAYLLRICVGAITALVIFIVAKAGVPIIADATRLGGDAAINPYFVSFLAIISGLMSENAILSVQNQGARVFGAGAPAEPDRWAVHDLRDTFKASNRDPERVKRLLQAKDDEFEGWVSGKERMPANVQMMIAGVLQTPARELFTDIPPDQAGSTA